MLLRPAEVKKIAARFAPSYVAYFIPKFDETEGQLYDYLQSAAKPGTLDDNTLKPRMSSFMITMERGPLRLDKSYPSFDVPIWPPLEGGSRSDNSGLATTQGYDAQEVLERAISHSQYNLGFVIVHPDDLENFEMKTGTIKDTAKLMTLMGDDSKAAIVQTQTPNHSDQRKERDEETRQELKRADDIEAKKKADDIAEQRAKMTAAKAQAGPRQVKASSPRNAKRRETYAAKKATQSEEVTP